MCGRIALRKMPQVAQPESRFRLHSRRNTLLVLGACALITAFTLPAHAETEVSGGLLIGTGVDTGDSDNNPYQLQIGGWVELIYSGFVVGFRGLRTLGEESEGICTQTSACDLEVDDLRSMGGDLGYEWTLAIVHLGPRFGVGRVREVDDGIRAPYLDPGGVVEVEIGPFLGGVDVRYRFVPGEDGNLDGLLAYAKLGLRF
jgi:hypothetical protein